MSTKRLTLVTNASDTEGFDRPIRLSVNNGGLHKVKAKTLTWGKLVEVLRKDKRTDMTQKKYDGLSADARQHEKKRAGFIFGGECANGHRTNANVQSRTLINLDIDDFSRSDFANFRVECGDPDAIALNQFEYVWYTTRSHTPEKPKFRIILPLAEACDPEKYVAISRIIASKFDPSMVHVDKVSYTLAQMMYLPLTNADGEFVSGRNPGKFIDVDVELEAFGDWHDFSKLPAREDEDLSTMQARGSKQADPREKPGVIGAFNRAYSIEEAIDEFIPEVYEECISTDKNKRYTYKLSHTGQTGGVIVYPDEGLLFSHHSSDPLGDGHEYSAFDMVRIHLFGHLDEGKQFDTPTKAKSFKAMEEKLSNDTTVRREMLRENYDFDAMVDMAFGASAAPEPKKEKKPKAEEDDGLGTMTTYDEDEETEDDDDGLGELSEEARNKQWLDALEMDQNGIIRQTVANVFSILANDARVRGMVALNEFRGMAVKLRAFPDGALGKVGGKPYRDTPVIDDVNGELWTDDDDAMMKLFLSLPRGKGSPWFGIQASDTVLQDSIRLACHYNRFHPVKTWFESVKWDGKKRLENLFIKYFGCPDHEYYRMTAKLSLIAAVDRIYMPGAKWDHVPILEGKQGKQKSTFIRVLANDWFAELRGHDIGNSQKMAELFEGVLMVEIPELQGFSKAEANELKAFFSGNSDKARAAYAKRVSENRRQVTFWGSTNDKVYLKDTTGNRRYWPIIILVDRIDIAALRAERGQLWAEAKYYRDQMRAEQPLGDLPLFLPYGSDAEKLALQLQEEKQIDTPEAQNAGTLEVWLDEMVPEQIANCNKPASDEDDPFADGPEVKKVRRDRTCIKDIMAFCPEFEGKSYDNRRSQEVAKALARIPGWKLIGLKRTPRYGQQRIYVRIGGEYDDSAGDL